MAAPHLVGVLAKIVFLLFEFENIAQKGRKYMDKIEVSDFWLRLDLAVKMRKKDSLKEVCSEAGVVYQTLVNQKCEKRYPTVPVIIRLCRVLECQLDWLILGVKETDSKLFRGDFSERMNIVFP